MFLVFSISFPFVVEPDANEACLQLRSRSRYSSGSLGLERRTGNRFSREHVIIGTLSFPEKHADSCPLHLAHTHSSLWVVGGGGPSNEFDKYLVYCYVCTTMHEFDYRGMIMYYRACVLTWYLVFLLGVDRYMYGARI